MKFIILGCGSSMGVPRADGFFGNCDPKNKKNYRTRCSALLKTSDENVLIDTSPDLRQQLLRHKIKKINKVLYSHMHGDHYFGLIGLISTMHLLGRTKELHIYGSSILKEIIQLQLSASNTELCYPLFFHPLTVPLFRLHPNLHPWSRPKV